MITQKELERQEEQAIMLSLLGVPDFRRRAGLPPREYGTPEKLEVMAALLDVSKSRVSRIEKQALNKMRRAALLAKITRYDLQGNRY